MVNQPSEVPLATRFIIVCCGSYGDLYPLLGIGATLQKRGRSVTLLANRNFEKNIRQAGLDFHAIGEIADYQAMLHKPASNRTMVNTVLQTMRPVMDYLSQFHPSEKIMLVCNTTACIGPRLAHEKYGWPMITIMTSPLQFFSSYDPPIFSFNTYPSWWPRWVFRGIFSLAQSIHSHLLRKPLNALREELGMPPMPRDIYTWKYSPQAIIGFFPDWFAKAQPDWPKQTILTGFSLFDAGSAGDTQIPDELEAFLAQGSPPIIFTPGTPNLGFSAFFEKAMHAVTSLKERAIFVTSYKEQIPRDLPAHIRHYEQLPFGQVFQRAALVVHHAGTGTMALAMQAGVPHLATPWGFDQFDMAFKIQRLGIGSMINPNTCTAEELAEKIRTLLDSPSVRANCQAVAQRMASATPLEDACQIMEEISRSY